MDDHGRRPTDTDVAGHDRGVSGCTQIVRGASGRTASGRGASRSARHPSMTGPTIGTPHTWLFHQRAPIRHPPRAGGRGGPPLHSDWDWSRSPSLPGFTSIMRARHGGQTGEFSVGCRGASRSARRHDIGVVGSIANSRIGPAGVPERPVRKEGNGSGTGFSIVCRSN